MLRRMVWPMILVTLGVFLAPTPVVPQDRGVPSVRAFAMDAVVTDRQGVRTELTSFGRMFGSGSLAAHHGDADIQIPFDRIRSFRVGEMKDSRAPVTVQLVDGTIMEVEIDSQEYTTAFTGKASFGSYRIMLGKISTCTLRKPKPEEPRARTARICPDGHIWEQDDYRFCPYDGKPLKVVTRGEAEDAKESK